MAEPHRITGMSIPYVFWELGVMSTHRACSRTRSLPSCRLSQPLNDGETGSDP